MAEKIATPRNDLSELAIQLRKRFGISVDRNHLQTALSRFIVRSPHSTEHTSHFSRAIVNKDMESHGDTLIRSAVNTWYEQLHKKHPSINSDIKEILNRNAFLTRIALRSGFTKYLMVNPGTARSNTNETIRQTGGSSTEAVVSAVSISSENVRPGRARAFFSLLTSLLSKTHESTTYKFIDKVIFQDSLVREFLIPFYDDKLTAEQRAQLVSRHLKGARLQIREPRKRKGYVATLTLADGTSLSSNRIRSKMKASTDVFKKMVSRHPWILWGFEGDARIYYPNMNRR